MSEFYWVRNNADFNHIDRRMPDDVIFVKNSDKLEAEFYLYSQNFHYAAEYIMDYLLTVASVNRDIGKLDTWFFAVVYLYRQSIELILKAHLTRVLDNRQTIINSIKTVSHNLADAYDVIKDRLSYLPFSSEYTYLVWLENFLEDISEIDKESDMFRYPFNQTAKVFFDSQKPLDLVAMRENLNAAYSILNDLFTETFPASEYTRREPSFLIKGGNYYGQSVVGYKFSQNKFYPYIKGYQEAADLLRDEVIRDQGSPNLLLPMCYLYRNAVELSLKRVLIEGCAFEYADALRIFRRKKHSVLGLWNSIKPEIDKHSRETSEEATIGNVEMYINQLQNIDSDSSKFRYPVNKNLDFYFSKGKKYSASNVSNFFNELLSFLDGAHSFLLQIREWENEMEAEFRNDYLNSLL